MSDSIYDGTPKNRRKERKAGDAAWMTANDRFKQSYSALTYLGLIVATAMHFAVFEFFPQLEAADLGSVSEELSAIELPPEAEEIRTEVRAFLAEIGGLSDDQRRLFARQMETYAGFISQTDHHFGRVIDFVDGVRLVGERGDAMQAAADEEPGTMAAVLGLDDGDVDIGDMAGLIGKMIIAGDDRYGLSLEFLPERKGNRPFLCQSDDTFEKFDESRSTGIDDSVDTSVDSGVEEAAVGHVVEGAVGEVALEVGDDVGGRDPQGLLQCRRRDDRARAQRRLVRRALQPLDQPLRVRGADRHRLPGRGARNRPGAEGLLGIDDGQPADRSGPLGDAAADARRLRDRGQRRGIPTATARNRHHRPRRHLHLDRRADGGLCCRARSGTRRGLPGDGGRNGRER